MAVEGGSDEKEAVPKKFTSHAEANPTRELDRSPLELGVAPLHSRGELISRQRAHMVQLDDSYQLVNSGGPPVPPATNVPSKVPSTTPPRRLHSRLTAALVRMERLTSVVMYGC